MLPPRANSEPDLTDLCRQLIPEHSITAIKHVRPTRHQRQNVYRLIDSSGLYILLKLFLNNGDRGSDADTFHMECTALKHLRHLGCPVPTLIAADANLGAIATEWIPGDTLTSRLINNTLTQGDRSLVAQMLTAFNTGFRSMTKQFDAKRQERIRRALESRTHDEIDGLAGDLASLIHPLDIIPWRENLEHSKRLISQGDWSHGSLDCNPSNIILTANTAYLIDISILGAEWCERRTVRYGIAPTSQGTSRQFKTMFNTAMVKYYSKLNCDPASSIAIGERIDLHHLIMGLQQLHNQLSLPTRQVSPSVNVSLAPQTPGKRELLHLAAHKLSANRVSASLRAIVGRILY